MGSFPQVDPRYCEVLASRQVPHKEWREHQKWVRYYLHFRNKYRHVPDDPESIPLFIGKLASKNQTSAQQDQARCAIEFYFVLLSPKPPCLQRPVSDVPAASEVKENFTVVKKQDGVSHYHQVSKGETDCCLPENREKSACSHIHADSVRERGNAGWRDVETKLKDEILLRHYSPKTLQAYAGWMRKLRGFMLNKNPLELTGADVKSFLTDLAVKKQVSASAQNQAFNALLFLFRHVLKKELGDLSDTPRAKRSRHVPTVLSKHEVDALFAELKEPYKLLAMINIRQVQQMLGHSDVRTTMIYTHTIRTDLKPLRSPLEETITSDVISYRIQDAHENMRLISC